MDFNILKEALKNAYKITINNPVSYFIKEKYEHLNSFYKKIIHIFSLLVLISIVFYYPASRFYSSWKNIRNFDIKTKLIRELISLSSVKKNNISGNYTPDTDPIRFIERKIPTLSIPKNQIAKIKEAKTNQDLKDIPTSTKVKTVRLEMKELNLKEVIQYGHQLEQLSDNIKLIELSMKESQEKENYFHVSYILSFFSSTNNVIPNKKKKQNKLFKSKSEEAFDKLKPTKAPSANINKPLPTKKIQDKKKSPALLDLKKSDFADGNTHFENRPTEVKKRDLLPALPVPPKPKNKKNSSPLLQNIPPAPDIIPPTPPKLDFSPTEKKQKRKQ